MSKDERLLNNLKYQLLTRSAIIVITLFIAFLAATTLQQTATPVAVILVLISIMISILYSLIYYMKLVKKGPSAWGFELHKRMTRDEAIFPAFAIIWDLINLTFLVIVTGGITSPFMPLFVIAVLVSDLCVDDAHDRSKITRTFAVTTLLAIGLNDFAPVRCLLITGQIELQSCPNSIWALNPLIAVLLGGAGFILSTLYGSSILRGFIDRGVVQQSQDEP